MRFVVIDFEATCDEPYNPDPQEIIEFPAVIVDPGAACDAAEFHSFVRPVAHRRLTPFCARLTGIRQEQVDAAPAFPDVLAQFEEWLRATGSNNALVVTCGDWRCPQCSEHNFARREDCYKCGTRR